MKKVLYCLFLANIMAGCATSPPCRFYLLSSTAAPSMASHADYSVSVGPISVPDFLDRRQIVVRTGSNRVSINEFERWASPLKADIGRVVVENLISLLGTKQISLYNQPAGAGATYRVMIDIIHFDSRLGEEAALDSLWTLSTANGKQSYRGRTTVAEKPDGRGYASLVLAHSRAVGRMSTDIANKILEMEARSP